MPKKLPPGIEWDESRGKFRASVYESGKRYRLGRFDTLIDAKAALAIARATSHEGSPSRACAPRGSEARSGKVARAQVTVEQVATACRRCKRSPGPALHTQRSWKCSGSSIYIGLSCLNSD